MTRAPNKKLPQISDIYSRSAKGFMSLGAPGVRRPSARFIINASPKKEPDNGC